MAACPACDAPLDQYAVRCPACGYDFPDPGPQRETPHDWYDRYERHSATAWRLIVGGYALLLVSLLAGSEGVAYVALAVLVLAEAAALVALVSAAIVGVTRSIVAGVGAVVIAGTPPLLLGLHLARII